MRTFRLIRDVDVTGVSGTRLVAEGVEFTDGSVALRWTSEPRSMVFHESLQAVLDVHGHGGRTRVAFSEDREKERA